MSDPVGCTGKFKPNSAVPSNVFLVLLQNSLSEWLGAGKCQVSGNGQGSVQSTGFQMLRENSLSWELGDGRDQIRGLGRVTYIVMTFGSVREELDQETGRRW